MACCGCPSILVLLSGHPSFCPETCGLLWDQQRTFSVFFPLCVSVSLHLYALVSFISVSLTLSLFLSPSMHPAIQPSSHLSLSLSVLAGGRGGL